MLEDQINVVLRNVKTMESARLQLKMMSQIAGAVDCKRLPAGLVDGGTNASASCNHPFVLLLRLSAVGKPEFFALLIS